MSEEEPTAEMTASHSKADDRSIVRRVLTVTPERLDILFTSALLLFMIALVVMSFDYRPNARIVPLVIAVPTTIILGVVLLMLLSERVYNVVNGDTESSLLGVDDEQFGGAEKDELDPEEALYRQRKRQVIAFGSVLSLLVLVFLVGYLVAIPIFLIVLYRWWAEQSWLVTLVTTVIVWAFVYVVFYILLGARLFTGVFDINIIGLLPF